MTFQNFLQRAFRPQRAQPAGLVPAGLYHFTRPSGSSTTRFHLRVEPDHNGLLLANASAAAHLTPTGVLIAKCALEGATDEAILQSLRARFAKLTPEVARRDIGQVKDILTRLAAPDDNFPILNLEESAVTGRATRLLAPWRADVPLAAPEQLRPLLERLWAVGIPHVTFLAAPGFKPEHLVRAVERAEDTGLIAGVRGRASDLHTGSLLKDIAQAGVDHVDVLVAGLQESANHVFSKALHDGLLGAGDYAAVWATFAALRALEVCPVAVIPLVEATLDTVDETLLELRQQDIPNISFFAVAALDSVPAAQRGGALPARGLPQVAALVESAASAAQVRYLWEPPVQYQPTRPLAEQVQRGPRCAGDAAVRVEPDGSVIPARGSYSSVGNVLTDKWETIWAQPAFRAYRARVEAATRCEVCPGLAICAADCPREPAGWAQY